MTKLHQRIELNKSTRIECKGNGKAASHKILPLTKSCYEPSWVDRESQQEKPRYKRNTALN
jgi:hypothetical protein